MNGSDNGQKDLPFAEDGPEVGRAEQGALP
jgi:hypothetical protein